MVGLGKVFVEEEVRKFVRDGEAEAGKPPLRPLFHQRVLLFVEIKPGEVGRDSGLDAVFEGQAGEWNGVQAKVHLKEGEHINGRALHPENFVFRPEFLDLLPYVFHADLRKDREC